MGSGVPRAVIELCFQSATLADGISALQRGMRRVELLNFLLRLCQQWRRLEKRQFKEKMFKVSEVFPRFIKAYIDPIIENSYITEERCQIRASKKLNEFLHSNKHILMTIFEDAKKWDPFNPNGKLGFTVRSAREFFYYFKENDLFNLNIRAIDECFVGSMMTVLDEAQNRRKYDYLVFVEFQEMLCRVCIRGLDPELFPEPIALKVQYVVGYIYDFYKDRGTFRGEAEENQLRRTVPEYG